MPSSTATFQIPEALAGKTLRSFSDYNAIPESVRNADTAQTLRGGFNLPNWMYTNPATAANRVDIGPDTPLTAKGLFNYKTDDPTYQGGAVYQNLKALFGAPLGQEQIAGIQGDAQTNQLVKSAQALRQFNIESAQPAIKTYQAQLNTQDPNSIESRYNQIIESIKGKGQAAEDQTTRALTSGLGARGLLPDSPEGQRALQEGLLPVRSEFANILGQTGINDPANRINDAIALLQTGNPALAQQTGLGLGQIGAGLQEAQLQAQTAIQNAQLQAQTEREVAQQQNQNALKIARLSNLYKPIFPGGALLNTLTGEQNLPGVKSTNTNNLSGALYAAYLSQLNE